MIVFDSSALLAMLFAEPGGELVAQHFEAACISTVNLAEVLARYSREGQKADLLLAGLQSTRLELVPFTAESALVTAQLIPLTQSAGLSLGDRACLALAHMRGLPLLTADRVWSTLPLKVEVRLIR